MTLVERLRLTGDDQSLDAAAALDAQERTILEIALKQREQEARIRELEGALRQLLTECEAEFMLDGRWVNDGQFVKESTCNSAREVL